MGKGGGASSAPSSQRVEQTSIPSYAQPYVENMLGQTAALTDINQNPYQQYSGQRLAGFTPLQNQAFDRIANQQVAPQIGQATTQAQGIAPAALGYGAQGVGIGQLGVGASQQGFGAGEAYRRAATSPSDIQAYMSPYMQNVVDYQKQEAIRDFQKEAPMMARQAVGQGAFGGNRLALQQAEANRGLQNRLAGIQATGTQDAFRQAQQAQQFGSELGLRGLQAGYQGLGVGLQGVGTGLQGVSGAAQGAGLLGNLGQAQFGQETAISDAQLRAGALQQALQQQGLDVGYQDFLKERNYPYQQLAFQSDMFRGLPLSQSAAQVYTAPPSMGSQIGGLGMTGLGIYGMSGGFKGAEGGTVKSYKKGGQINYAIGGNISMMSTQQLQELLNNPQLSPMEVAEIEKMLMLRARIENNPQAQNIMGGGLDTAPSGDMFEAAGGGIVAFSEGGDTDRKQFQKLLEKQVRQDLEDQAKAKPFTRSEQQMADIEAEIKERSAQSPYTALTAAGLGTLAGTSQYGLTNLGLGGIEGLKSYSRSKADEQLGRRQMLQQQVEAEKAELARRSGLQSARTTALTQSYNKDADIERSKIAKAQLGQGRETQNMLNAQRIFDNALKAEKTNLFQQNKAKFNMDYSSAELDAEATANVMKRLTPGIKNILFPEGSLAPDVAVPAPAAAPAADKKSFPKPSGAAVKQLRDSDNPTTRGQFDAIFGPGAAQRALGK
jgi:hypothetical protein